MQRFVRMSLIVALSLFVVAVAYFSVFRDTPLLVRDARKIAEAVPVANIVPAPLKDESVTSGQGKELSYFGYRFEVPWTELDETNSKVEYSPVLNGEVARVKWRSGQSMTFLVDVERRDWPAPESSYEAMRETLETTSHQITLLTPRKQAYLKHVRLTFKADALGPGYDSNSAIYSIQTNELKGFEFARAASLSKGVRIELFSPKSRLHLSFQQQDGFSEITQADINRVLQTLRKIGPS